MNDVIKAIKVLCPELLSSPKVLEWICIYDAVKRKRRSSP